MALERGIGGVIVQPSGDILFPMNDGPQRIPCRVTPEALYQLTRGRLRAPARAFTSVRLHIEAVASVKYEAGVLDKDGGVTVSPADFR